MRAALSRHVERAADATFLILLLTVAGCTLNRAGIVTPRNLHPGAQPRTGAISCDIEMERRCSTESDRAMGIRLSEAAIALAEGRTSTIGLDDSPDALSRCSGQPEAVGFAGPFPQGLPVCVNCAQVLAPAGDFADGNAVCRAKCYDLFGTMGSDGTVTPTVPPTDATVAFCDPRSFISANTALNACTADACSEAGTPLMDFLDPRRIPEPVLWTDFIGTAPGGPMGAHLTRTAPFTLALDAGAVSTQWISHGDSYVEFNANRNDEAHGIGMSPIPPGCPAPCADADPGLTSMFGLGLWLDGRVYVFEGGGPLVGPDVNGSFGTYTAGERFRVRLRDNGNGTATVTYTRLVGACGLGMPCNETLVHTSTAPAPAYPFRVDATIRETGATLIDVRVVRIQ